MSYCPSCGAGQTPQSTETQSQQSSASAQPVVYLPTSQPVPAPVPARSGFTQFQWKALALSALIALTLGVVTAFLWPADKGEIVADTSIGPAGGTIPMSDGGRIEVPQGAVRSNERVTVRRTVIRETVRVAGPDGVPLVYQPGQLPLYVFEPAISFLRPVTVILPLSPNAVAARIFVYQNGQLRLVTVVPSQGRFVRIAVTGFSNGLLVVQT